MVWSRGSNEPPLQVNDGGLKTQAVNFHPKANSSSVQITLQENANSIGKVLWAQVKIIPPLKIFP